MLTIITAASAHCAVVWQALPDVERAPQTHMMAVLNREKFSKHQIQLMV